MPWVILPIPNLYDMFRIPKSVFFDISCMAIIVYGLWRGIVFTYRNKYLAALCAWIFFTVFMNWYLPILLSTGEGFRFNIWTIEHTFHFIFALFAFYFIVSSLISDDYMKLSKAICVSSALISIFGLLQYWGLSPFGNMGFYLTSNKVSAFLDNPNLVGNYLCVSLPFFLYQRELKYKLMGVLPLACLLASQSVLSIVISGAVLLLYLLIEFKGNKRIQFLLLVLLSVILLAFFLNFNYLKQANYDSFRAGVWAKSFEYFKHNPLFGQGMGIFKTFRIQYAGELWREAHNDWLEMAINIGLVGVFLFILLVINSIRNFKFKVADNPGLPYLLSFCSFLLLMTGSFVIETAPIAFIGLLNFCAVEKL